MKRRSRRGFGLLAALGVGASVLGVGATPARAAGCDAGAVRFASSSNSLYVTGPVTCTLSDLDALTTAPLAQVDPGAKVWLLGANLILEQGATLNLHGSEIGGDVDELRLRSNKGSAATDTVFVRAHAGTISMRNTKVISWDEAANGPDTDGVAKRSYVQARSFLDGGGVAQQSRMDIIDSEVGFLGFHGPESYGLSWKVLGTNVFDRVDVFGDVINSRIHDNHFGIYTYGAYGMRFVNNDIHNNVAYGLDPHDDSDNLLIEGNRTFDNGNHGIICSQRCDNLIIRNNVSERNTGHGIMIHRGVTNSLLEGNTANGNSDTGIVAFESFNNRIVNNTMNGNLRGLRLSVGAANNLFQGNTIAGNRAYGIYLYKGSDVPVSGNGHPKLNRFVGNQVRDNGSNAVFAEEADDNVFDGNTFLGNRAGLLFERSANNYVINSTPADVQVAGASTTPPSGGLPPAGPAPGTEPVGPTGPTGPTPGAAPAPATGPTPKLIDSALACPRERVPSGGFTDVEPGNVHRAAVDCLAWYGITSGGAAGRPADNYGPELQVRRGQMASFLVRVIDRVDPRLLPAAKRDFSCPSDPGLALADSNPHADAIRRLAGAGVVDGGVGGRPADCFGPELDVRRDQMAAFLHRALELASGDRIRSETDAFDDDRGNPHESTINALTGEGLLAGKSFRVYDPSAPVRRDQMASFLTRKLSYLVDKDRTTPPK
ncbi:MAG: right-handed parallel beta-helix repeat-containing protein [Actinobacteria bacterium]|nr:right-handed parallel beta-helix repeat-containing protein [Actinomycetota bacterium]